MMIVWSGRCYVHLTSHWHAPELQSLGGGESLIVAHIVQCNRVEGNLSTKIISACGQATMGSVFLICWPMLHSTCANAQLWSKLNLDWLLIDLSPSPLINVGSEKECGVCFPNYSQQDHQHWLQGHGEKGTSTSTLIGKGLNDDLSSHIP